MEYWLISFSLGPSDVPIEIAYLGMFDEIATALTALNTVKDRNPNSKYQFRIVTVLR